MTLLLLHGGEALLLVAPTRTLSMGDLFSGRAYDTWLSVRGGMY